MSRPSNANNDHLAAKDTPHDSVVAEPSTSSSDTKRGGGHDISRRVVRSTRTPLNYGMPSGNTKTSNPHKGSASGEGGSIQPEAIPPRTMSSSSTNAPPTSMKSVGTGSRRPPPRVPAAPPLPPTSTSSRQRHDSSHSQHRRNSPFDADADPERSFLSIPDSQNRQSTASSFYTDPSSYYSAESRLSFLAGLSSNPLPNSSQNVSSSQLHTQTQTHIEPLQSQSPDDSGSSHSHSLPVPHFRPPAMPTPPIPPLPTNVRSSMSTGHSVPEPSRQSTSDSAAYTSYPYPAWLVNSISAPPMPTLERHPEATEDSSANGEGEDDELERGNQGTGSKRDNGIGNENANAPDDDDEWEDEKEDDDDGWQMPEPMHHSASRGGGHEAAEDGYLGDGGQMRERGAQSGNAPSMPKAERQMRMPIPTFHQDDRLRRIAGLGHGADEDMDIEPTNDEIGGVGGFAPGYEETMDMPRQHPPPPLRNTWDANAQRPRPPQSQTSQDDLPLQPQPPSNQPSNQPPSTSTTLSPTRRPYASRTSSRLAPVVIPPPPKTPPPVPSPERDRGEGVGLAVGGLWDAAVGVHAHTRPPHSHLSGAEQPTSNTNSGTAPLRVQHHAKGAKSRMVPSSASEVLTPTTNTSIAEPKISTDGPSARKPAIASTTPSATHVRRTSGPTTVTVTSNSRLDKFQRAERPAGPPTASSAHPSAHISTIGTISTPLSSRPNTQYSTAGTGTSSQKPTASTSRQAHQAHFPSQSHSHSQGNVAAEGVASTSSSSGARKPTISGPQPMKISTSSGSQTKHTSTNNAHLNAVVPMSEKVSTAPSSSGHTGPSETMRTSSTAALAAALHQGAEHTRTSTAPHATESMHTPERPRLIHGTPSQMDTQYVNMLLALDDIPMVYNLAASFFNWILLAGFILFPGTFTNLQTLSATNGGVVPDSLVNSVTQVPLFVVAWICCAIGGCGMLWLWWRWRRNYIWGLNKIFAPGLLNSLAGLLSTIASVYGAQNGQLSVTSKVTLIVTIASSGVFLILTGVYSLWVVKRVKRRHDRDVGMERAGRHGEGVVDLSKRRRRAEV